MKNISHSTVLSMHVIGNALVMNLNNEHTSGKSVVTIDVAHSKCDTIYLTDRVGIDYSDKYIDLGNKPDNKPIVIDCDSREEAKQLRKEIIKSIKRIASDA